MFAMWEELPPSGMLTAEQFAGLDAIFVKHFPQSIGVAMPLTKSTSKQAFQANVRREVQAGKPPRQAVAIAYSVKRKAQSGRKR